MCVCWCGVIEKAKHKLIRTHYIQHTQCAHSLVCQSVTQPQSGCITVWLRETTAHIHTFNIQTHADAYKYNCPYTPFRFYVCEHTL